MLVSRFNTDPALIEDIDLDPVLDAIGVKRHELQAKAIDLGRDFFDDPSTDFLDYVEGVWGDGTTF